MDMPRAFKQARLTRRQNRNEEISALFFGNRKVDSEGLPHRQ